MSAARAARRHHSRGRSRITPHIRVWMTGSEIAADGRWIAVTSIEVDGREVLRPRIRFPRPPRLEVDPAKLPALLPDYLAQGVVALAAKQGFRVWGT